jgi:tetratricopeptide (TPR) repeat protein
LLDGNFFVPESIFVRRYCYDTCGPFDETLRACEDWDMWLRFTKRFSIIHTPQVLTRHRILAGSMSADPVRMLTNRLAVLTRHVGNEPLDQNDPDSMKRRAYGRAYLVTSVEYLQFGDTDRAFGCFQKMAKICPELLSETDTFYQLGCGEQPKGSMGDLPALSIERNSATLLTMLKGLFDDAGTSNPVKRLERTTFARAYFALGLLAYGTGKFKESRRFLARAVTASPPLSLNNTLLGLWLKSLIHPRLLSRLKGLRKKQTPLGIRQNGQGA